MHDSGEDPLSDALASARRRPDVGQVSAILDAAQECFSRGGYAGTAMREIAERAGVSKGLLHYHFASKEQLFVTVQMRAYERLAARVARAVAPVSGGKDRGLAALDALVVALSESNDLAVQAELWAGALSNEKLRAEVVRLREFFHALLVRSLRDILAEDAARLPVSLDEAADLMWAVLNGAGIESAFGEARERTERAFHALRVLAALALTPQSDPTPNAMPLSTTPTHRTRRR